MSTRVISGSHKGRRLEVCSGEITRPSSDRVKEALFSSLESLYDGFEGRRVLDLFAGSGGLGIEALSRGAAEAHFFEKDRIAAEVLEKNLFNLQLTSQSKLSKMDVFADNFLLPLTGVYDIILLDPPYKVPPELVLSLLTKLSDAGRIKDLGIMVYEHGHKTQLADTYELDSGARFVRIKSKKYGQSWLEIFEHLAKGATR